MLFHFCLKSKFVLFDSVFYTVDSCDMFKGVLRDSLLYGALWFGRTNSSALVLEFSLRMELELLIPSQCWLDCLSGLASLFSH